MRSKQKAFQNVIESFKVERREVKTVDARVERSFFENPLGFAGKNNYRRSVERFDAANEARCFVAVEFGQLGVH